MLSVERINSPWGSIETTAIQGDVWRIVESQEEIATVGLVDNLDEQYLLEQMLDDSKPPVPTGTQDLNYLLSTPFRYPPLAWGSRFGTVTERSIFYGSEKMETALAEVAYYRFIFLEGMSVPPPVPIQTQHTAFQAGINCKKGVDLFSPPFDAHRIDLVSPDNYQFTQAVGTHLRQSDIDGFRFESARCPSKGANIAIIYPEAIIRDLPKNKKDIVCLTTTTEVSFSVLHASRIKVHAMHHFAKTHFLVKDVFPVPC